MTTPLTDDELREIRAMINAPCVDSGKPCTDLSCSADLSDLCPACFERQQKSDEVSTRLLAEVDRLQTRYETALHDHCDEDTAIRDIARPVLGDAAVDGDSVHRPGMVDVVQAVVDRLRAELAETPPTLEWLKQQFGEPHLALDGCTWTWGNGIAWYGERAYKKTDRATLCQLATRADVLAAPSKS